MAAADLGERAPWPEPGADRDAQQVEHVRLLVLDRACPRTRAGAQPEVRSEEAGERRARDQREAEPPGRERQQRERGERHDRRGAELGRHQLAHAGVEAGGVDACGEPAGRAAPGRAQAPRERPCGSCQPLGPPARPARGGELGEAAGGDHACERREDRRAAHDDLAAWLIAPSRHGSSRSPS